MSKKIPLNHGRVALVDDDDYAWLNKYAWYADWNPHTQSYYAMRTVRYGKRKYNKKRKIYMHREILNAQLGQQVDHKSHDTEDNRKANLRLCTNAQNSYNQKRCKKGSSQYKGTCWYKPYQKWMARLQYKGRQYFLGYFTVEAEAAQAYDAAALKYFGEFAKLNFPNKKST